MTTGKGSRNRSANRAFWNAVYWNNNKPTHDNAADVTVSEQDAILKSNLQVHEKLIGLIGLPHAKQVKRGVTDAGKGEPRLPVQESGLSIANKRACKCNGSLRTVTMVDDEWYGCPRCGGRIRRDVERKDG